MVLRTQQHISVTYRQITLFPYSNISPRNDVLFCWVFYYHFRDTNVKYPKHSEDLYDISNVCIIQEKNAMKSTMSDRVLVF